VDESTLRVEQVELAVEARPSGSDGGSVGEHAEGARDLGEISSGNVGGRFVANSELETGRAPINELNGTLGLDLSDGRVDVLGDDISSVEKSASHVLSLTRIALDPKHLRKPSSQFRFRTLESWKYLHLVRRLEARVGELRDSVGLVRRLASRNDGSVGSEREMDTRERYQVD
jgi:hypothetical protein